MKRSTIRWFAASLVVSAAGVLGSSSTGCNAITNTTSIQCKSEAECVGRGAGFESTTCDLATHTCVKVEEDLCKTNKECITKNNGQPAICRKDNGKCIALITPECPVVYQRVGSSNVQTDAGGGGSQSQSALEDDNSIVIGAITPAGVAGGLGDLHDAIMQLGISDLQKNSINGLPGINGGPDRPLVFLSCREYIYGIDGCIRAAKHLAVDVKVPLIIGPVEPADFNVFGPTTLFPLHTTTILPYGFNSFLFNYPNPIAPRPLVWSNSFSDLGMVKVYQQFITQILEPRLKKEGVTEPTRVAILEDNNTSSTSLSSLMEGILTFNGKNALDPANGGNYARISLGANSVLDAISNPQPEKGIGAAIDQINKFKPHIILHSYPPPVIAAAFFPLVINWPAGTRVPYHIDMSATLPVFPPIFDVLNFANLQGKTFSSSPHRDADRQLRSDAWVQRFKGQFGQYSGLAAPAHPHVQEWYDAVFLAAYSIVAVGNKPINGENLADALKQMNIPGTLVKTDDPGSVQTAFATLTQGKPIDLDGITSDMNIDPTSGRLTQGMEIWCPHRNESAKTGGKISAYSPGHFYIDDSGQAIGDLDEDCF